MHLETDRVLVPAGASAVRYLTATLTAPESGRRTERPPAGVALVLDRSGSMAGRKLEMAKKAVAHAVQLLSGRDRLAVIAYDHEVTTVLAAAPASAEARALAARRLREIDARGNTDLASGWLAGLAEAAAPGEGGGGVPDVRKVLLLSDGLANQGETDPDRLAAIAAEWRAKGVTTSTFGLGADFDEVLMARLAREGGGHFYYVEDARQIPDYFATELGETLDIVARDATFDVLVGPAARVTSLNDFPVHELGGPGIRVQLGDLVSGQVVGLGFAVHVGALAAGDSTAIECLPSDRDGRLAAMPGGAAMPPMRVQWTAAPAGVDAAQPVNETVLIDAATLLAARSRAEALEANRRDDFDAARRALAAGAAGIRGMAAGLEAIERIARELESEGEELSHWLSPARMKAAYASAMYVRTARSAEGKARRRTRPAS